MKIVTFCDYPVYMCFYKALSDIGNHVIILDLNRIPKESQYAHISKFLDEEKPDIVLTVGRPEIHGLSLEDLNIIHIRYDAPVVGKPKIETDGLSLEALRDLCKKKGIFHVYWATEDRSYHQKYSMKIAHNFDFIFTPSQECIKNYNAIGKPAGVLRYGCDPALHRNVRPQKAYLSDIAIAATYHQGFNHDFVRNVINVQENDEENLRKKSIETIIYPLIEKGYTISIWGNGWDNVVPDKYIKGYFPYEKLPLLYSSSKIILGLEWDNISETKTTGRPFEVLGCRTFFLTFRTKALLNMFTDRNHLALSDSPQETLELVHYYLNNDLERNKIAEEGQKEVYSRHTYYHRAGEFINILKPFIKNKL